MKRRTALKALSAIVAVAALGLGTAAHAGDLTAKSVVLVHGAFADGSAWNRVIPLLEEAGLDVIAAQIPLSSLDADVETTQRAIDRLDGPVVLVGHSWGGMVITEAGAQDKVHSLVYVAAFAPNEGQSLGEYIADYPHADGLDHLEKDAAGYYRLTDTGVAEHFAFDLPEAEIAAIAASQGPINSASLGMPVTQLAWKHKPNFAVVSTQDRMTLTEIQRDQIGKLNAQSVEVDTSHVPMLTHPDAVANMIIEAAK
ncbi:alpha/beta hydrolase [Tateyamaria omphalii]|uniref:alpha/beta fold hydrolase n=1 Tax=Tateyamaria omphalii TaxID=299262 RepID=UPI001C996FE5|nr:alpha/beta hydrolase [Tateyamaria omphalii]MBY5933509.1 alpha/beta hydrolase [Tateyamaria omphalii]